MRPVPHQQRDILNCEKKYIYILAPGMTFHWDRNREEKFKTLFIKEVELGYCFDKPALIHS